MSGKDIVEYWERGFASEPPELVASLLHDDEDLLWAARLKSVATAKTLLVLGAVSLIIAAILAIMAPWGQTIDEYCGPDPGRCAGLFYLIWPAAALCASIGFFHLWSGWNAKHRPWFITYAISITRAFLIKEPRSKDFHYIHLRLNPPKCGPSGVLVFEGSEHSFVGLGQQPMSRACYWAIVGRQAFLNEKIGGTT